MARKLSMKELGQLIREEAEVAAGGKDVQSVAKKTKEVEADEYADTLEKEKDHLSDVELNKGLKENKLKEHKLLRYAKALRAQRIKLQQEVKRRQVKKLVAENKKLKAALKKKSK